MAEQQEQENLSWPQLLGKTWVEADKFLKENHPDLTVIKAAQDSMMTMDFRTDRVRVFVDSEDKVVKEPRVG